MKDNASMKKKNYNSLLRAYIGANYDKLYTRRFNWSAFFFTSVYMMYRGLYLQGFLFCIIANVISLIFNIDATVLTFLSMIIAGLSFNDIYLSHVKKQINKIKVDNDGYTIDELKIICLSKGGARAGVAVLALFFLSAVGNVFPVTIDPVFCLDVELNFPKIKLDEEKNNDEVVTPSDEVISTYSE